MENKAQHTLALILPYGVNTIELKRKYGSRTVRVTQKKLGIPVKHKKITGYMPY